MARGEVTIGSYLSGTGRNRIGVENPLGTRDPQVGSRIQGKELDMMWGFGNGMGVWGPSLMITGVVGFWILVIVGVIALVRYVTRVDRSGGSARTAPEQILAGRFAAGEIDDREYQQRLDVLRGKPRPAATP
jgi:putative membrane protein